MKRCYRDILSRIAEAPRWFDEHGVPRFDEFSPDQIADIYARECCLVLITCQSCGHEFKVALSWHPWARISGGEVPPLSERVRSGSIYYGDPPNIECCPAGPTMSSEPRRVLEFWLCEPHPWRRVAELETEVSG